MNKSSQKFTGVRGSQLLTVVLCLPVFLLLLALLHECLIYRFFGSEVPISDFQRMGHFRSAFMVLGVFTMLNYSMTARIICRKLGRRAVVLASLFAVLGTILGFYSIVLVLPNLDGMVALYKIWMGPLLFLPLFLWVTRPGADLPIRMVKKALNARLSKHQPFRAFSL